MERALVRETSENCMFVQIKGPGWGLRPKLGQIGTLSLRIWTWGRENYTFTHG